MVKKDIEKEIDIITKNLRNILWLISCDICIISRLLKSCNEFLNKL